MPDSSIHPVRMAYLDVLLARYATLSLPVASLHGDFALEAVFQPLKLRRDPLAASDRAAEHQHHSNGEQPRQSGDSVRAWPGNAPRREETLALSGPDALRKSPTGRLVVLGAPGTGKTTLLRHLLTSAAREALTHDDAPLPLFINLPELARSGGSLRNTVAQIVADFRLPAAFAGMLASALDEGTAFVCLDSLDEVAPAQRGSLIAQINSWAAQPGNTWIVGSRFAEYKGGQFASARFAEWELQPLDAERRHELARRLLPILRRLANDAPVGPSDPALPGPHRSPTAFVAALETHPQAAAWGENPLLFSLAAVGYAQVGVLPVSRATLYREVIAAVLATREPEAQQRDELRAVAAEVALRLHQTKGRTFSRAELESHVRAVRTEQEAGWTPDDMAHRIVGSGLLDVVAYETYTFRHQTFQEYLAAVALAARMTSDDEAVREAADEALAQILSLESGIEDD